MAELKTMAAELKSAREGQHAGLSSADIRKGEPGSSQLIRHECNGVAVTLLKTAHYSNISAQNSSVTAYFSSLKLTAHESSADLLFSAPCCGAVLGLQRALSCMPSVSPLPPASSLVLLLSSASEVLSCK